MNVLFLGRKTSGASALKWLLSQNFPIVGVIIDDHVTAFPVRDVVKRHGLKLLRYDDYTADIKTLGDVDLAVSFLHSKKIKDPLLSYPRYGIINFHPAPLPALKGCGGYNVAILEGYDQWAVTAHYVTAEIDAGPIIDSFTFSIDAEQETAQTLERKSQEFLLSLFKKTLRRIREAGRLNTKPNNGGRYISRADIEAMKGIVSGDDIDRKIRAFWFPPYDGAWIEIAGVRYTLVNRGILQSISKL